MKIGIFTPYLDNLTGGEKYILTCASCLSLNHEVFLFWDINEADIIKAKVQEKFGISLQNVRFTRNIFSYDSSFLTRLFQTRKYDRILFLSDGSIPLTLSKLILHFQFPVQWVDGRSIKTRIKFFQVASVICNSQFTKLYIDKTFGIQSTVLYPPCDTSIFPKKKENIILHVGRFGMNLEGANYKKQDVMIGVFKELVDRGLLGWKFVLIMSVAKRDEEKLASLKKISKGYSVEFVINANKSVVSNHYSKAKIYWHASGFGEDLQKYPEKAEHFGIATVEAMAGGCVPVVIEAGGQKEIVEDGVSGFLWKSKEELIKKTEKVIENQKLWNKLSENARQKAKVFSSEKFCSNLYKVVEKHE